MRISDWSSDVCSSDLARALPDRIENDAVNLFQSSRVDQRTDSDPFRHARPNAQFLHYRCKLPGEGVVNAILYEDPIGTHARLRSEEHTSELQSLMRISYAVYVLKKKTCIQQ